MDQLVADQLERGLRQRGCVICRIGDEAARHYLGTVLHEYVSDLATRKRLAAPPSDRRAWQRVLDLFAGTRGADAA